MTLHRALSRGLACVLLGAAASAHAAAAYVPQGTCAGFPRLALQVPSGYCIALVANAAAGLRFPRRILEIGPGRYWLLDMGSWEPRRGRLLEMHFSPEASGADRVRWRVLAEGLDRPLGLALGPDGKIYIGEAGRIWRTPLGGPLVQETVVDQLPDDGAHPLKEIAFGRPGQLFINVGSATDACRDNAGQQAMPCAEAEGATPRAAIYEARLGGPQFSLQSLRPWARGLRNSVALAYVAEPGVLLQGENSVDYPDETAPVEELNVLHEGRHYGWPYCLGPREPARGYESRYDCAHSEAPQMLWPAHAAPLQMLVVPASSLSPWAGQMLVAWHGYRAMGHRVVAFTLNAQGVPQGPPREWIAGWSAQSGVRPLGAPTGITVDSQGRLWVVEDRNRTLLMLVRDSP